MLSCVAAHPFVELLFLDRLQRIEEALSATRDTPKPTQQDEPKFNKDAADAFENVYLTNLWGDAESFSGPGSTVRATTALRTWLGGFIVNYSIKTFVDLPCGDANWQGLLPGLEKVKYYGFDISTIALARANKRNEDHPYMESALFDLGSWCANEG